MYKRTPVFAWFHSRKMHTGCSNFRGIVASVLRKFQYFWFPCLLFQMAVFCPKMHEMGSKGRRSQSCYAFHFSPPPFSLHPATFINGHIPPAQKFSGGFF